jgi:NTE family protein
MKKLGLALGGGGARGYAHLGILKVLKENNIPVHCISGTSIGAIVGSAVALGHDIDILIEIACNIEKVDLLKLVDINNPKISLVKGNKVREYLTKLIGEKDFKDTIMPLGITAAVLEDGSTVIFREGNIIDAIMASITLPVIFPPVKYKGINLIDGGLADPVPVDAAFELGADVVLGIDLFNLDYFRPDGYSTSMLVMERVYEIVASRLAELHEKEYDKRVLLIKPKLGGGMQTLTFFDAKKNIVAGEEAARDALPKIRKLTK